MVVVTVVLTLFAVVMIVRSGTGFEAQTNQAYQAGIGANHRGDVDVLNLLAVANPDGTATLSAGLVNQDDAENALTGVTVTTLGGDPVQVASPAKDLALPPSTNIPLGQDGGAGVYVIDEAPVGLYITATFSFESGPDAVVEAPVVTRGGDLYEDVSLG